MSKFCTQCGHPQQSDERFCQECGKPVNQETQTSVSQPVNEQITYEQPVQMQQTPPPAPRKPRTKKQKAVLAAGAVLLVAIAGSSYFASNYYSAESTLDRFKDAVQNEDAEALASLMVLENGAEVDEYQAEAFLSLPPEQLAEIMTFEETDGFLWSINEPLLSIQPHGKVAGVINRHAVIGVPQYVELYLPTEDEVQYAFSLNGASLGTSGSGESINVGPFLPGNYLLDSTFSSDYGELTASEELMLTSTSREYQSHYIEPDMDYVIFSLPFDDPNATNVVINGHEIPFNERSRETAKVGPLPLNGSVSVKAVATYPWGTLESDEIAVSESLQPVTISHLTEDQRSEVGELALAYAEQTVEANANQDASFIKDGTEALKTKWQDNIEDMIERNRMYSGQLNEIQLMTSASRVTGDGDTSKLVIPASLHFYEASHIAAEPKDPEEFISDGYLTLSYNADEGKFYVDDYSYRDETFETEPDLVLAGSEIYHESIPVDVVEKVEEKKETASATSDQDIETFIVNFRQDYEYALNEKDFAFVQSYFESGSSIYREYDEYIHSFDDTYYFFEFLEDRVTSVEKTGEDTYKVNTAELFDFHNHVNETWRYTRTKSYILKVKDNQLYIDRIDMMTDDITEV
ncbi:zinc ribbon domain-containing protein [Jeotgalibacillus malaysiensis]|uniref:zinc ribbon domain-containing protein n=1 Tax=Jeotgalibacillus malaysiensis TaxID=1508404 RepID=UPI00384BE7D6